jgi:hypothetical protein
MVYVAVLVACLISAPSECRSHEMFLTSWHPTMQAMEAQTKAVEWLARHPGYEKRDLRVVSGRGV